VFSGRFLAVPGLVLHSPAGTCSDQTAWLLGSLATSRRLRRLSCARCVRSSAGLRPTLLPQSPRFHRVHAKPRRLACCPPSRTGPSSLGFSLTILLAVLPSLWAWQPRSVAQRPAAAQRPRTNRTSYSRRFGHGAGNRPCHLLTRGRPRPIYPIDGRRTPRWRDGVDRVVNKELAMPRAAPFLSLSLFHHHAHVYIYPLIRLRVPQSLASACFLTSSPLA
jgi:hypothetical protein